MTLLRQLEAVATRYAPSHRIPVVGFLARRPRREAFELFDSSPALGLLLAHCDQLRPRSREPWKDADHMVLRPRPEILGWLGFPSTQSAVRIVGKVDVTRTSVDHCITLRDLIQVDDVAKRIRHLPVICDGVIDVLANEQYRCLTSYTMLTELSRCQVDDEISRCLGIVVQLAELHGVKLRTFRTCASVMVACQALEFMEHSASPEWHRDYENIDFPDPPIPVPRFTQPTQLSIEPIRSPRDLYQEALCQHSCVFDLMEDIASGRAAVYRVLKPERATVMLVPKGEEGWVISEFRATRNRPVRRETILHVAAYLTRRQERVLVDATCVENDNQGGRHEQERGDQDILTGQHFPR